MIKRSSLGIHFSQVRLIWRHVEVRYPAILAEASQDSNRPNEPHSAS
jgi:hypothetical protein